MKNSEIIQLVNAGVLMTSNHDLEASQAYKVFKLRKAVDKAFRAIQDAETALLKEVGIDDGRAFDKRLAELKAVRTPSEEQSRELAESEAKLDKFSELRKQLLDEQADLAGIKTIPYEDWRKLQDENRAVDINGKERDVLSGLTELILEGILWAAPETEKPKLKIEKK